MDKHDRMVVLAGIFILIIAVAGIVYHERTYVASEELKEVSYRITWNEDSGYITEKENVDKDGWQNEYYINLDENASIYSIEVNLEWTDDWDFHGFILPWNWSDKIDMSVDINELQFSQSVSGYNSPIKMNEVKNKPKDKIVEEANKEEIDKIIKNDEKNEVNCKVSLSIEPKPMILDRENEFR